MKIIIPGVLLVLLLAGCANINNGDPYIRSVDDNGKLKAPWGDPADLNTMIGAGDAVSIFLDRAFFRYLPDSGNSSEVLLILEFDEGLGDGKKVTKVVGPFNGIPDGTQSAFINKLVYGPKPIEGSKLSLHVTVLELDSEENEKNAAMLDFVVSAQETLGIANPVTTTQMKAAKEVAKALLAFNRDDELFTFEMDFVADKGVDGKPLRLAGSHWVAIKREVCPLFRCYGQFYNRVGSSHVAIPAKGLALIFEAVAYIPISLVKILSDSPGYEAVRSIEWPAETEQSDGTTQVVQAGTPQKSGRPGAMARGGQADQQQKPKKNDAPVYSVEERGLMRDNTLYRDKTWLSFSIYKGGDTSSWRELQKLSALEEQLLTSISTARTGKVDSAKNYLQAVKDLESPAGRVTLLSPLDAKVSQGAQVTVSFMTENPQQVINPVGGLIDPTGAVLPQVGVTVVRVPNGRQLDLTFKAPATPGNYMLRLLWLDKSGEPRMHGQPITII